MLALQSDLKPAGGPRNPARLAFSPDGLALLASTGDRVQVWPRLDAPPRPVAESESMLERVAFTPDGGRVYLYRSGSSRTDVLDAATGGVTRSGLPEDPAWFHFDTAGGFCIVCRDQGNLVRFDYAPKLKKKQFREAWVIDRWSDGSEKNRKPLGSHYRFGAIGAAAGVFVSLEYKFGGSEPFRGLTVRSVTDGSIVYHQPLKSNNADKLLDAAGLTLAIHPSGRYMAYPDGPVVRFRALAEGVKVRAKLPKLPAKKPKKPAKKPKPAPDYHAVAFSPNGVLLAVVGDDSLVTLYDTSTWKVVKSFAWKVGKLRAVCFSADGFRAAALSANGKIMVWDIDI